VFENMTRSIIRTIKSRRIRWVGHAARIEKRNAYRILIVKPEEKRPVGRPKHWWEDIKMDLRRMVWYRLDSSGSGYGPVEGSCEHGNVLSFSKMLVNS
jgi:hypothetical protein